MALFFSSYNVNCFTMCRSNSDVCEYFNTEMLQEHICSDPVAPVAAVVVAAVAASSSSSYAPVQALVH